MRYYGKLKIRGTENSSVLAMAREEHKGTFLGDGNVLVCSGGLKYAFVKTHGNVHLMRINFIICKLDLNKPNLKKKKRSTVVLHCLRSSVI